MQLVCVQLFSRPCLFDAPWQDDRQIRADRGHLCHRQTAGVCAHYIWLQLVFLCALQVFICACLCEFMCLSMHVSTLSSVCMCARAVVMVQSGRSILKTLSGGIDFLFPDPWKCSCNTADPPSCVTLSFCDTDQSEDELEIATRQPWTLSGGRGGGDVSDRNTHITQVQAYKEVQSNYNWLMNKLLLQSASLVYLHSQYKQAYCSTVKHAETRV